MAIKEDLEVIQGAQFDPIFEYTQSEGGPPVDLTNAPVRFTVRHGPKVSDPLLFELVRGDAQLTINDAAGTIQPLKTAAQTAQWEAKTYYYALNVTIGGRPDVLAIGKLWVFQSPAAPAT